MHCATHGHIWPQEIDDRLDRSLPYIIRGNAHNSRLFEDFGIENDENDED